VVSTPTVDGRFHGAVAEGDLSWVDATVSVFVDFLAATGFSRTPRQENSDAGGFWEEGCKVHDRMGSGVRQPEGIARDNITGDRE